MIDTDVVIGAGPGGFLAGFELGPLISGAIASTSLPMAGGQCVSSHSQKPNYDVPGLPSVIGQELVDRPMERSRPFDPVSHQGDLIEAVEPLGPREQPAVRLRTCAGKVFLCKAVVAAADGGSIRDRDVVS